MMLLQRTVAIVVGMSMCMHLATGGQSSGLSGQGGQKATTWPGHLEPLGAKAVKKALPSLEGTEDQYLLYSLSAIWSKRFHLLVIAVYVKSS